MCYLVLLNSCSFLSFSRLFSDFTGIKDLRGRSGRYGANGAKMGRFEALMKQPNQMEQELRTAIEGIA